MEKYKFQAKSKDDLLDKALNELNVKEEDVITKCYEEKGGLFSGKKYTIEVVKLTDIAETGRDIILELLNALNIQANVETKIRDRRIKYEIFSKNNSLLIGKKGHILNSIQTYVRQALYTMLDIYIDLTIDVEKYKELQQSIYDRTGSNLPDDSGNIPPGGDENTLYNPDLMSGMPLDIINFNSADYFLQNINIYMSR